MPRKLIGIMSRVEWIKEQLLTGHKWNASTMAEEFSCSTKTIQHTLRAFRELYPDWIFDFDPRERTYYLDSAPDHREPQRPAHLEMSPSEFSEIRGRISISQDNLAACIDVSQTTIRAYETGACKIPSAVVLLMRAWERACQFGVWRGRQRRVYRLP